jgi:hypothetical protein
LWARENIHSALVVVGVLFGETKNNRIHVLSILLLPCLQMYFAAWSTYEAKFLYEKLTELRAKILNLVGDELFDLFFTSYASTMFALG